MIYKSLTAVALLLTAGFGGSAVGAPAPSNTTTTPPETTTTTTTTTAPPKVYTSFDPEWLLTLKAPKDSYWDKVAQCETQQDWQDGGKWAGGLGIYVGTWDRYGGRQFAKHPSGATRKEQITVANRIALYGWQTKLYMTHEDKMNGKPFFRNPVGFNGWGCIKNNPYLKPPVPNPWEAFRRR